MLPPLWLWRVRPVSSDLPGKLRRTEGNLPTRSATLFQAAPLRFVGPLLGTKAWRCSEAGLRGSWELDLRRGGDVMRTNVTSGPLATSNIALLEAWSGRSLVICHGRHQDHGYSDKFEMQLG